MSQTYDADAIRRADALVLELLDSAPRLWSPGDVIAASGLDVVTVLVCLARLTHEGRIDHPTLGVYRSRAAQAAA